MVCKKCGDNVYRAFSYYDAGGVWHSEECESCYPIGKAISWTPTQKVTSRSLAPDGRTVISGMAGVRMNDAKRRASQSR